MLSHPTLDILNELALHGCAKGFKELEANPAAVSMSHGEWLITSTRAIALPLALLQTPLFALLLSHSASNPARRPSA